MRRILLTCLALFSVLSVLASPAGDARADDLAPVAYVIKIDGVISPATYDLISRHLRTAAEKGGEIVILEMDTPGGLYESMKQIIQAVIDSPVPVATYVSPAGSHAASAGTFILYASHVAAMAPGTNIGAATPVNMGQPSAPQQQDADKKKVEGALERKMVNDASAYIRTLAEMRGRNLKWAEEAVREAETLTASEALSKKVIDQIAEDLPSLLDKIDGMEVRMSHGATKKLRTKGATVITLQADWRTKMLEVIAEPNIAMFLMSLGSIGLIYEVTHPGSIAPGVIGAIAMLLGLYAMNVLPVSTTGFLLLMLGILLMAAEAFVPAFGILGIGGAIAFAAGGIMLFDSVTPGFGVDPLVIGSTTLFMLAVLSGILTLAVRARRQPVVTGQEELLNATGTVLNWAKGKGEIHITGERWGAEAADEHIIKKGDAVRVVEIKGMTLRVVPATANETETEGD